MRHSNSVKVDRAVAEFLSRKLKVGEARWAPTIRHRLPVGLVILSACTTMSRLESPAPAIEADRPDFTESPTTVPSGSVQAEGGYTYTRQENSTSQSIGELLVRVPAGPRAELRVGFNSYWIEHAAGLVRRGLQDMAVGTKIRLIEHGERSTVPNVSIIVLSTLPTGHRSIGSRAMQPTAKFALGWQLSERFSLQSNLNYSYAIEDGTRFSQWANSASFGADITPRLETFVEWFGTNPVSLGARRADYLNTGAAMKFGGSFRLDARIGTNARTTRNYFAGLGVSRRW
ncbi:MAG: transporter [Gemmatimonadota bacterium]|nr:transporter [Gemmatimonadota bacterium]